MADDRLVWVCPVHPDRSPKFNGGALWCQACKRALPDAVQVALSTLRTPR
jgi:hypothetical protein